MKYNLRNIVRHLCKVAGVSRSGYYNYFSVSSQEQRKQNTQGKTLLTDITYLSTILDGSTNEILAYHVSEQMTLELVTTTLHKLKRKPRIRLTVGAYIHSDQGAHYTSPTYQKAKTWTPHVKQRKLLG